MSANQNGAEIQSAAERISGVLSPEPELTEDNTPTPEPEAEPETLEVGDTQSEAERYTVKVNGEELDVSIDDLKKSYMMEADYRQKTSKVSEDRKTLELGQAELSGKLAEMRSLIEFESAALNSDEMQELRDIDPDAYLTRVDEVKAKAESYKRFKADADGKLKADRDRLYIDEQQKLIQAIPDYLDNDNLVNDTPKLAKSLSSTGFSDDEIGQISDHRVFVLARKAMLYDELMSQDPGSKKVNQAPTVAKPAAATTSSDRAVQSHKDTRTRLRKTGHVRDAQKAIQNLLK